MLGGGLGIASSKAVMWTLTTVPGVRDMLLNLGLSSLDLKPFVALLGLAVSVLLGIAAGFVPAWGAYRARITDMLRTA
jgi:ABC-type antimicrobial peptide transport system permease subunit